MQLLLHIPDGLLERFKQAVPARQRSEYIAKLLERALPPMDEDPLYLAALETEQDLVLGSEMRAWREGLTTGASRAEAKKEKNHATG